MARTPAASSGITGSTRWRCSRSSIPTRRVPNTNESLRGNASTGTSSRCPTASSTPPPATSGAGAARKFDIEADPDPGPVPRSDLDVQLHGVPGPPPRRPVPRRRGHPPRVDAQRHAWPRPARSWRSWKTIRTPTGGYASPRPCSRSSAAGSAWIRWSRSGDRPDRGGMTRAGRRLGVAPRIVALDIDGTCSTSRTRSPRRCTRPYARWPSRRMSSCRPGGASRGLSPSRSSSDCRRRTSCAATAR